MILIEPISPVAIQIGSIAIRWYALAYIAAFAMGFCMLKKIGDFKKKQLDDLITYLILGVIIGGRLGYVLFYNLPFFIAHPLEIFMIWHGGMAFHGGLLGVIAAVFLFAGNHVSPFLENSSRKAAEGRLACKSFSILDMLAVISPIGLFFGRIANFINMEVMGRMTLQPWGIVFSGGDPIPRHPSPLYEACLEGIILFVIMFSLWKWTKLRERTGALSGIFAMLYAVFRIFAEQFRQPDEQLGFLLGTSWMTMGMALSALMFIAGAIIFAVAMRRK